MKYPKNPIYLSLAVIAVSSLLLIQPLMAQVPATPGGGLPAPLVQVENPFEAGTGIQQVAPSVEATLAEFADTTRNRINQVLRDTATENEATAYTALIDAARRIVQASNRTQRGRELLTRIFINQALELTTGTPDASGVVPPARTGLLTRLQTPSLDTLPLAIVVLRQSFEMARSYADQDLAAATALEGNASSSASAPLQLPYAEAATTRLNAARAWNRIATTKGPELEYQFLRISIQQWRNIVTNPNHQQVTALAIQIARLDTGVARAAARLTTNPPTLTQFTEVARVLRGFLREATSAPEASLNQRNGQSQTAGRTGACAHSNPTVLSQVESIGVSVTGVIRQCHSICPHFDPMSSELCTMTQEQAASSCRSLGNGMRLPTIREMATLMNPSGIRAPYSEDYDVIILNRSGNRDFTYVQYSYDAERLQRTPAGRIMTLEELHDHYFWTDSLDPNESNYAYSMHGANGGISRFGRGNHYSAWCVSERPRSAFQFNGLF
jgi:hypothetical protein